MTPSSARSVPEEQYINVAASIIADISSGIYRTPANALKELISNAFDADATEVAISTDYPRFDVMTCTDNGNGMSRKEFVTTMGRIGGSEKRADGDRTGLGRRIIGKIGIGILAVAQIANSFSVISSKKGDSTKFEARIDLLPFQDQDAYRYALADQKVKIGRYVIYRDLPEESARHYTTIVLKDVKDGFKRSLMDSESPDTRVSGFRIRPGDPKNILEFVQWLQGRRVRDISEYNRLLWELAVMAPVPYLGDGPVKGARPIPEIRRRLLANKFRVRVDGLELRKPLLFPTDPEITKPRHDFQVYDDIEFEGQVDEAPLRFSGYIYHQRKRIYPPELGGILVRIRDVAIDSYDRSLLNYPKSEGPMASGISGEIYVEEGLEGALNIDRNSFRESDPHYLKLQEVLFDRLGAPHGITMDVRRRSQARSDEVWQAKVEDQHSRIARVIKRVTGEEYQIVRLEEAGDTPIRIAKDAGRIYIYENPIFPRRKAERLAMERMLILFEMANQQAASKQEARDQFYRLIRGR